MTYSTPNLPPSDVKPRVLHLLKWLPRGGIETWLTHVFEHSRNGAPVAHELLLMQDEIGPYEAKVRAAGVPIHIVAHRSWMQWFRDLRRFLNRTGPYAAMHVHVDSIVSGPVLAIARAAGIPVRIIHNHAARSMGDDYQRLRYRLREKLGNSIAAAAATRRLGISDMAMTHLAGDDWRSKADCKILLYGFDYSKFRDAGERAKALRERLGIAAEATVVGHVGRFDPVKNHRFLLESFARYAAAEGEAVLVLIGKGPLQPEIERQAADLGIAGKVVFAGGTDDIAAFMRMFDVFVFPSFSEGLGIVVLEAQAAGTPVIMPDNMPHEVIVIEEGVTLLPLSAGTDTWAATIGSVIAAPAPDPGEWLARIEASSFGLHRCVGELNDVYAEELARHA